MPCRCARPPSGPPPGAAWPRLFGVAVFAFDGTDKGLEFITGYIVEWSLSVDNLFVFLMILPALRRPVQIHVKSAFLGDYGGDRPSRHLHRHRGDPAVVLHLADLRLRGVPDLRRDQAPARGGGGSRTREEPGAQVLQGIMPVETSYDSQNFFVRREGKLVATALMPVMIVIATTDIMFAIDSIPAILAITRVPFIVYTSKSSPSSVCGRSSSCWRGSWGCSVTCRSACAAS